MAIDPFANCNPAIPPAQCTLATCCLAQSNFLYIPNFGANLFFALFFGLLLLPQAALALRHRTWGFAVGMLVGLALEVGGYAARLLIHANPFNDNAFLAYLIALTIAPTFLSAAIYLCLTRIMAVYGAHLAPAAPRTVALAFMTSDFLALLLQAVGGGIADTAATHASAQVGIDIMIAGLVLQALSLAGFLAFIAHFAHRCRTAAGGLDPDPARRRLRARAWFRAALAALLLATVAILVRSIFRAAELWGGFAGRLWNDEPDFLALDGAMVGLAAACLTLFHPGPAFGPQWHANTWSLRSGRARAPAPSALFEEGKLGGGGRRGDEVLLSDHS